MTNTIEELLEGITDDRIKESAIREVTKGGIKLSGDLVESYLESDLQLGYERLDLVGQIPERPIAKKILAEYIANEIQKIKSDQGQVYFRNSIEDTNTLLKDELRIAGFTEEANYLDSIAVKQNLNRLNEKVREVDRNLIEGAYNQVQETGYGGVAEKDIDNLGYLSLCTALPLVGLGKEGEATTTIGKSMKYVWEILNACNLKEDIEFGRQYCNGKNPDFEKSKTYAKEEIKKSLSSRLRMTGLEEDERQLNGEIGTDILQKCATLRNNLIKINPSVREYDPFTHDLIEHKLYWKLEEASMFLERSDETDALNDCYRQLMHFEKEHHGRQGINRMNSAFDYAIKLGDIVEMGKLGGHLASDHARRGDFAKAAEYASKAGLTNQAEAYQKIDELSLKKEK
jgi:hypothetical protein